MTQFEIAKIQHKFSRHRLAVMFYATAALSFTSTLTLALTAHYFAQATTSASRRLSGAALLTPTDVGNINTFLGQHRLALARQQLGSAFEHRQTLRAALNRLEDDLLSALKRSKIGNHHHLSEVFVRLQQSTTELQTALKSGVSLEKAIQIHAQRLDAAEEALRRTLIDNQQTSLNYQAAVQSAAHDLDRWTNVSGLLALLCTGPLSYLLLRRSVRRLTNIARALRHLAHGHLDSTALIRLGADEQHGGSDEITDMIEAIKLFHKTAASLNESREQIQKVNRQLQVALENMSRGLSMFSPDETLIVCNNAYKTMYDLPEHLTVSGASLTDLLEWRARASPGDSDVPNIISRYRAAVSARSPLRYTRSLADGRTIEISLEPLDNGGWVTLHQDVTKQREAEAQISRLAKEDSLTGLVNRRGFTEALEAICKRNIATAKNEFALLCIDLDLFKSINDSLGHPAGDEVLRHVAQRLRSATRQQDVVARIGGDEFAVIIDNIPNTTDVERLAERIVNLLAEPMQIANTTANVGASIGIALGTGQPQTSAQFMASADMALYWAKSHGRNTWRIYDADLEGPIKIRRQLENEMRPALADRQFSLNFQPILGLEQRDVIACEALLRWQHPQRGNISPADFIPIAEKNGFIKELGAWVLNEACRAAMTWPNHVRVAVNLSPVQLQSPSLFDIVATTLQTTGLPPQRLELEVTETALLDDSTTTIATLNKLKDLGIKISLDDFGTGYSSLSHLRAFPFDQLKIDQSFVRDISNRDDCVAIVKAVASLAASLEMTTVAEGVETHDHLHRVNLAGCSAVQGYLFSKPVPTAEVPALFDVWRRHLAA